MYYPCSENKEAYADYRFSYETTHTKVLYVLDYVSTKPVIQFTGSVTDREVLVKACRGVASVFHLASIVDYSMFPDEKKMDFVNVEGMYVIIILYPCSKFTGTVCFFLSFIIDLLFSISCHL